MKIHPADEFGPSDVEFTPGEESEINAMVNERAEELATAATSGVAPATWLMDRLADLEEPGELALTALRDIVTGVISTGSWAPDDLLSFIRGTVGRALQPIAELVAEGERDAIERRYIHDYKDIDRGQ